MTRLAVERSVAALLMAALLGPVGSRLSAQLTPQIAFSGELRLRGEWDGRTAGIEDDAATLSRIRLGARVTVLDWLSAFAQVQDARAWGTEGNTLTDAGADQLDLHEGYAELGRTDLLRARLGRQELSLGDERLVGAVGWSNTGRAFDGARVYGNVGGTEWTAFWMNVAERDALLPTGLDPQVNQGDQATGADGWLLGAFLTRALGGATAELTVLADRNAVTSESYTLHARLHGTWRTILFDAAAAYQFGPDRSAHFATGMAGMTLGPGMVAVQVDYLSGDDDPVAGDAGAFNTLYATNHRFYGYMDYFLDPVAQLDQAGLVDAMAQASADLSAATRLRADVHHFWAAQDRGAGTSLGTEVDVVGAWTVAAPAALEVGAGLFFPSDPIGQFGLPAFGGGIDPTYWGYLQLTVRWP
jgi:hypothetical protein